MFLSSHVLSEVQTICDRVDILREGKLRAVELILPVYSVLAGLNIAANEEDEGISAGQHFSENIKAVSHQRSA